MNWSDFILILLKSKSPQKYFPNHGGIYNLIAYKILYLMIILFLKGVYQFVYRDILEEARWFGVPLPELLTFSEIFWFLPIDYSLYKKTTLEIFVYLFICEVMTNKVNFRFYKQYSQAATRLKLTLCKYSTSIKIKISITYV